MSHVKVKKSVVATAVILVGFPAAVLLSGSAPTFAAAGERHVIKITPDSTARNNWSAEAQLFDGQGRPVYHWHEEHYSGTDFVRWEYTDRGDNGWIDLSIHPSDIQYAPFQHLSLAQNHCYRIVPDDTNPIAARVVEAPDCPFSG